MSEYKRLVSYFYSYKNEKKGPMSGHGKVEVQGAKFKISIECNATDIENGAKFPVYFFWKEEGVERKPLFTYKLGEAVCKNKELFFRMQASIQEMIPKGRSFDSIDGILIFINEQESLYQASVWSQIELGNERFDFLQPQEIEENETEKIKAEQPQEMEENELKKIKAEQSQEMEENELKKIKAERPQEIEENKSKKIKAPGQNNFEESKATASKIQVQSQNEWREEDQTKTYVLKRSHPEIKQGQRIEENIHKNEMKNLDKSGLKEENLKAQWRNENIHNLNFDRFLSDYPKVSHFKNTIFMNCVRIEPQDIGRLPKENWHYGTNSFLLHGYYNYHYLLCGYMRGGEGKTYKILGIPGIYTQEDCYLGKIFGFHEFAPVKMASYKTGEFGYWIGKIEDQFI